LIELAIALFVIVLLLGSLLVPLATQVEQRRSPKPEEHRQIKEALLGYAAAHGHLPCRMSRRHGANDGIEDVAADAHAGATTATSRGSPEHRVGRRMEQSLPLSPRFLVRTTRAERTLRTHHERRRQSLD